MIDPIRQQKRLVDHAKAYYAKGDNSRWCASAMAAQIMGNYQRGATLGLAQELNLSVDSIESMAHAYDIYSDLKAFNPLMVRLARKTPGVYLSHFRALYDIKNRYGLDLEQILDLLMDIVQATLTPNKISSRDVEAHAQSRYGVERPWLYYAQRTYKEISKTLDCPDLPGGEIKRKLLELHEILGDQA